MIDSYNSRNSMKKLEFSPAIKHGVNSERRYFIEVEPEPGEARRKMHFPGVVIGSSW